MVERTEQAVLLGIVDIHKAGLRTKMLLGDVDGDGRMELLLAQPDGGIDDRYVPHQVQCMTVFDLQGNLLWQVGTPDPNAGGPGSDYPVQLYDIDGDGQLEVLCVMDKQFRIYSGRSGELKKSYPLPDPLAHDCIIIANLRGLERPQDIILKDRYRRLWALDNEMNVLWTYTGNPGHFPWVYDIDGDGCDEVMAGYDMLDHDGTKLWSCKDLDDHADCIWIGDVNGDGEPEVVVGGSVTVMYSLQGSELWRYDGSIESQHVALGRFRTDMPGLQIAGLDRIERGDNDSGSGRDGMFLLDSEGREVWKEQRVTGGWLTMIEPLRGWEPHGPDYILAYRRGGGVTPALYDGHRREAVRFPVDGYVVHADLLGTGREQVIVYTQDKAYIYASRPLNLSVPATARPLPQPKRLYSTTLYFGGEVE
ncbi:rhamnogalacturonan lyase family protein [Paenibacillus sp. y28]|uniref:rhamnogalacturonan lyase family protein n=1 Tax=Paenibacillus sp. y28 TaxID=3129110 RepID=UPI0030186445